MLLLCVKVPGPELFQSPEIVSAEEATGFKIPLLEDIVTFTKSLDVSGWNWPSEIVKVPVTFIASESTSAASPGDPAVFEIVTLLKSFVVPTPLLVTICEADPSKVTVPLLSTKVPLLVQSPPTVML